MDPIIHTLASGATVLVLSPGHGFRFSDGTSCGPQKKEICDKLTLRREMTRLRCIKGMACNRVDMVLSNDQVIFLEHLSPLADIVLVPLPVLIAIREAGVCYSLPNVVAMNATEETQRSAPADKIVDIDNWSV